MVDAPIPRVNYSFVPSDGHNVFREKFGHLSDAEWCAVLRRSAVEPVIEGVHFPGFPEEEFQNSIHGNHGDAALNEAGRFFEFIKSNTYLDSSKAPGKRILDFGCGWGRIIRPFMRDFEFKDLYGFDPNFLTLALARVLNPYVAFLSGPSTPNDNLPAQFFNLAFGWSVFSHLSPTSAVLWLKEMARIVVPGGWCVFTTWGDRFLSRLSEEAIARESGKQIHWYSAVCIDAAGSIKQQIMKYEQGDFVWFTGGGSTLYGEAFVSEQALQKLISQYRLPFEISVFDKKTLAQDVFVLKRL